MDGKTRNLLDHKLIVSFECNVRNDDTIISVGVLEQGDSTLYEFYDSLSRTGLKEPTFTILDTGNGIETSRSIKDDDGIDYAAIEYMSMYYAIDNSLMIYHSSVDNKKLKVKLSGHKIKVRHLF